MKHPRSRAISLLLVWLFAAGALLPHPPAATPDLSAHAAGPSAAGPSAAGPSAADLPHDHGARHKPATSCEVCVTCLQHCANLAAAGLTRLALLAPTHGIRLTPAPLLPRAALDLPPPLRPPRVMLRV